jgi:hypothetical protein
MIRHCAAKCVRILKVRTIVARDPPVFFILSGRARPVESDRNRRYDER